MLGSIGMPELILIFVIALIVFGPKKLPEIGKSLGKGLAEFKRASDDLKQNIQREVDSLQAETKLDVIKPDVIKPDVIKPDVIKSDVVQPDVLTAQARSEAADAAPALTGEVPADTVQKPS